LVKSVNALQEISSQSFDSDGNRDSLIDPNKNQTQFAFDLSGRLTQETLATGDKVKYTYSARDLLESVTNGRNQQRQFKYDAAGRLTSWTDPDGTVSYTYDGNGNVLTVTDANGTITREYDPLNRITKYTDQQGNTLQYEYDQVGNLATLTYPDGKQVHYEYNSANQLTTVMDWAERETLYTYDPNGRLISTLRPNGTQMTRIYDEAGKLIQQKDVVIATGEIISQFDFKYDAAGNIIEEKTNFEPDPEINLEMTYQAANRLATYNDKTVQFDADGNMTKGFLSGELVNFEFDSRNRLIQAGSTVYRYDAENQRIGVNQTNYVVNSQPALSQVLVKTEADGTQTFYVYGLGLIGQEIDGDYTNYHFDLRGSTVVLTDETAQIIERFQYSPYGLLLSGDVTKTPFLFNGMYGVMTDDNGLYYMRSRFYSPEIKRFVNQDILLGDIREGQTLNRYAYVTGRPVSLVDPFGLKPIGCPDGELVPLEWQPHAYECIKDGKPIKKLCADPTDKRGCRLYDARHGGNNDGPRPYAGIGGYIDEHFIILGITVEDTFISEGGKYCRFKCECASIGPGFFVGSGTTFPFGISMSHIDESLAGKSVGLSFDIGSCWLAKGSSISMGHSENGITSIGSSKGSARLGAGCGLSLTVDFCETTVQWCKILPP
jgi:RHS repeat-associated protein